MRIAQRLAEKANDNFANPAVTIAFLGDSVTQGCFEIYRSGESIGTVFDKNNAYHAHLSKILSILYPTVPVNIINAGVSGGDAKHGLMRLERDVISHSPDLCVVCFALNDCMHGKDAVGEYVDALQNIFKMLDDSSCEIIFMTPPVMNTYVHADMSEGILKKLSEDAMQKQLDGTLDLYVNEARRLCCEMGITVCDCYAKWKKMQECGIDTTALLANHINHPTREMNWLFAFSLVETML